MEYTQWLILLRLILKRLVLILVVMEYTQWDGTYTEGETKVMS